MTEEAFLALARAKYAEIHRLNESPNLLDYEQGFVEIWTELGREVAQTNLGKTGKDRRKKKESKAPLAISK
jgi:hypothetical protein